MWIERAVLPLRACAVIAQKRADAAWLASQRFQQVLQSKGMSHAQRMAGCSINGSKSRTVCDWRSRQA